MKIDYLEQLPDEFTASAARLYLKAFEDKLIPILGDDSKALRIIESNLDPTQCLAAVCGQQLVGILAIQSNTERFIEPKRRTMIRTYGMSGGILRMLGLAWMDHSVAPGEFYVDGVAVVKEFRGKGVGTRLFFLLERMALKKKIHTSSLEVIDTNSKAEALYRRLGFQIIKQRSIWPLNYFVQFPFKSTRLMIKNID